MKLLSLEKNLKDGNIDNHISLEDDAVTSNSKYIITNNKNDFRPSSEILSLK